MHVRLTQGRDGKADDSQANFNTSTQTHSLERPLRCLDELFHPHVMDKGVSETDVLSLVGISTAR